MLKNSLKVDRVTDFTTTFKEWSVGGHWGSSCRVWVALWAGHWVGHWDSSCQVYMGGTPDGTLDGTLGLQLLGKYGPDH